MKVAHLYLTYACIYIYITYVCIYIDLYTYILIIAVTYLFSIVSIISIFSCPLLLLPFLSISVIVINIIHIDYSTYPRFGLLNYAYICLVGRFNPPEKRNAQWKIGRSLAHMMTWTYTHVEQIWTLNKWQLYNWDHEIVDDRNLFDLKPETEAFSCVCFFLWRCVCHRAMMRWTSGTEIVVRPSRHLGFQGAVGSWHWLGPASDRVNPPAFWRVLWICLVRSCTVCLVIVSV